MSRLLMPMGSCAILGGTITMVGSSPLILVNDLILASNKGLPPEHQMQTWSLFTVIPVGPALLASGIAYFVLAGRFVLPGKPQEEITSGGNALDYFRHLYGLDYALFEAAVPAGSPLVGRRCDEVESSQQLRVIAIRLGADDLRVGLGSLSRGIGIEAGSVLGLLGAPARIRRGVRPRPAGGAFRVGRSAGADQGGHRRSGDPASLGTDRKDPRDVWMRKT